MQILIVEDEPLIAEDIAACLLKNDFEVAGIAYSIEDAYLEFKKGMPDLVLLDINFNSKMEGISLAHFIHQHLAIPFIFITSYADKATLEMAKVTHPSGYLVKPFNEAGLYSAIEVALFNYSKIHKVNNPDLSLQKLNKHLPEPLSVREFELLQLINEGLTNKQIADSMFISTNTVKKHINHIYLKLDTISRSTTLVKLRQIMKA